MESESGTPAASVSSSKRVKKEKEPEWSPPPGSWENDVQQIETVDENINPKTGAKERWGFVLWKNGSRTQHPLELIYRKCPQKVSLTPVWLYSGADYPIRCWFTTNNICKSLQVICRRNFLTIFQGLHA